VAEELDGQVAAEPDVVPDEAAEGELPDPQAADPNVNDADPNPVEALASELGWSPKDQFRGNPDDWKPADEFIRAGRDIQRNLSRDIKELKSNVGRIVQASTATLEQTIAEQRAKLETQFKEAVDLNDHEGAYVTSQKLGRLSQPQGFQTAPTAAPTAEGEDFAQRNAGWYGKDQEATRYAVTRAQFYADQGLSAARQLAAVERDMKPLFPDLFPAAQQGKAAPQVRQPQGRTATATSRQKGFHDLPADAQKVAKDMVERGVIPAVDSYVTNYFAQTERKVG
jgi:hypothetical protein